MGDCCVVWGCHAYRQEKWTVVIRLKILRRVTVQQRWKHNNRSGSLFTVTSLNFERYFHQSRLFYISNESYGVFPPASSHRYMKVFVSVSVHFFLVELFTLIIFRLRSISLIVTGKGEIAKSLKMHFFQQKSIRSQLEDDQSVRRRLNWPVLLWIEDKVRTKSNLAGFVRFLTSQTVRIRVFKLWVFLS
jgi:hypothetical protein